MNVLKSTCHWFEGTRKTKALKQILYICLSKILVFERPTVAKLKKLLNWFIS